MPSRPAPTSRPTAATRASRTRPSSGSGPTSHAGSGATSTGWTRPEPRASVVGAWLHELDQDAAGVLGVQEVDPAARRAAPGLVVERADAALAQHLRHL